MRYREVVARANVSSSISGERLNRKESYELLDELIGEECEAAYVNTALAIHKGGEIDAVTGKSISCFVHKGPLPER